MKDKPVKFIAITPNTPAVAVTAYQGSTGLGMPIFADNLGLMEKRYGMSISLNNIYQFRVIGPDGKVVANVAAENSLGKLVKDIKVDWKYKDQGYDAKFEPAIDAFEWGQHARGMRLLTPLRKSTNKALAQSANKLFAAVKKEGEEWKEAAEAAAAEEPIKAFDLYAKVATVFTGDELAKSVVEPLRKLASNKAVSAELAARKAYAAFLATLSNLPPQAKQVAIKPCQDIVKKHAGTPTATKAAALLKELGG